MNLKVSSLVTGRILTRGLGSGKPKKENPDQLLPFGDGAIHGKEAQKMYSFVTLHSVLNLILDRNIPRGRMFNHKVVFGAVNLCGFESLFRPNLIIVGINTIMFSYIAFQNKEIVFSMILNWRKASCGSDGNCTWNLSLNLFTSRCGSHDDVPLALKER